MVCLWSVRRRRTAGRGSAPAVRRRRPVRGGRIRRASTLRRRAAQDPHDLRNGQLRGGAGVQCQPQEFQRVGRVQVLERAHSAAGRTPAAPTEAAAGAGSAPRSSSDAAARPASPPPPPEYPWRRIGSRPGTSVPTRSAPHRGDVERGGSDPPPARRPSIRYPGVVEPMGRGAVSTCWCRAVPGAVGCDPGG